MNLKKILQGLKYEVLNGSEDVEINKIEYDSRKVEKGDVFVCIKGYTADGHNYIKSAIELGATAIICERELENVKDINVIKVEDTRKALAIISSAFYGNPKDKIKLIGITGTNGKTTSTFMIKSILEKAGYKVGLIGTIANYIGEKKLHTERTTPESLELHKLFSDMVKAGVQYCVMEVSSHSLYLDRVYGISFCEGIFTNLTRDHLDFHKTFENYYDAKLILFKNSINSVINIDDEYGCKILEDITGFKTTIGIENKADIIATNIEMHSRGVNFNIKTELEEEKIKLNIPGKYNVMNSLGAITACFKEGIPLKNIKEGLESMLCVPGRCEIVTNSCSLDYDVIVDYAHTPDGLENILKTAREFTEGKLISIFGCGGDRDKTKRPIMGKIGTDFSDLAIITSDNPRKEEPSEVIKDIIRGIDKNNYLIEENRREAIKKGMKLAKKGDIIVVAGKGHEDYQVLKDKTISFDERVVIKEIIEELSKEK